MPRGVKKEHLPSKMCITCNRPFTWRKKWERCWDEVTTCSKSCNRKRKRAKKDTPLTSAHDEVTGKYIDENSPVKVAVTDVKRGSANFVNSRREIATNLTRKVEIGEWERGEKEEGLKNSLDGESSPLVGGVEYIDEKTLKKEMRKALKKEVKAQKRAKRQGLIDVGKPCNLCEKNVQLLIRCRVDSTLAWNMVCGSCWTRVSGGVVDGDTDHPWYTYGGLWKSR